MRPLHHGRVSLHRAQVPADRQRLHCQPQQTGNKVDTADLAICMFDYSMNQIQNEESEQDWKGKI